jgi:hypothetical protein
MTGEKLECKRNKVDKKINRHWLCARPRMDLRATPEDPQYPKNCHIRDGRAQNKLQQFLNLIPSFW